MDFVRHITLLIATKFRRRILPKLVTEKSKTVARVLQTSKDQENNFGLNFHDKDFKLFQVPSA